MTHSSSLATQHYFIEQENMLKDMDFCHLQEIYLTSVENSYWIQD